ncbi:bifunctional 2-polyprenyl-6-hydroxyphenol methylase/3-demethylubiquinol 3-O-methyltransferase UbiG [Commensalibacter sp. M0357]|uniref:bifunctional 2-polyprenyl-6-hydroxyphenol methylase/3-demethylubiquinol 3-O-methyltransferase UbiG n=1 Tax=Commensalibacter TaxID=1079922 RepID=UPI0012D97486|nr:MULTISPECIES: bifunctional 2-polyprenyl-6-hydroxyphenol methylase/3-demethylubiquinol 3-O-methyltransferase UbiG [Commensalibacter]MBI0075597.1 bifunctional 2-polyprenyl-6-hydroxyphenol methylase/3-demethylubiquinol 3-O-methyltransferase UbiG [Commensalibacter sp. M0357]MBI0085456.1 bifunctional 2-polyprenyl-6-hydroxyphenol methylase/3-demethylubiquinol 3-O-methyltransferase UbiG [Commensalibacter sp. M0355]MUG77047.1 bifunctional 2-polyprenyl-6-hydroxyphenol methylase/3-demethylubiquinol 3-O
MPIDTTDNANKQNNSIITNEIDHFNQLADQWWDRKGPMSSLHDMNDLRIEWINRNLRHNNQYYKSGNILDIGCGAGLASEALANMGYNVLGIDAGEKVIKAAQYHLDTTPLLPKGGSLTYKVGSIEELVHENQHFSVITALELLEHVNDPQNFIHNISRLLQTNGMIFVSTINRTLPAFLFAKVAAEYITRKLPVGTHNWRQFITPSELGKMAHSAGLRIKSIAGMTFYPNGWKLTQNVKINYIACLTNS